VRGGGVWGREREDVDGIGLQKDGGAGVEPSRFGNCRTWEDWEKNKKQPRGRGGGWAGGWFRYGIVSYSGIKYKCILESCEAQKRD
jgi:hypothetical protein